MSEDAGRPAEYHDVEEVEKAIEALSEAEHVRLNRVVRFRAQLLDHHPRPVGDELLQEALTRTLDGRRRWRKGVDFIYHLDQAMKSIANSWRKGQTEASLDEEPDARDTASVEAGQEWLLRGEPAPERVLLVKERLELIRTTFSQDAEASEVIEGWAMEMTGPEIQECSGMSKKAFEAAVHRIRYRLSRSELGNGG